MFGSVVSQYGVDNVAFLMRAVNPSSAAKDDLSCTCGQQGGGQRISGGELGLYHPVCLLSLGSSSHM